VRRYTWRRDAPRFSNAQLDAQRGGLRSCRPSPDRRRSFGRPWSAVMSPPRAVMSPPALAEPAAGGAGPTARLAARAWSAGDFLARPAVADLQLG